MEMLLSSQFSLGAAFSCHECRQCPLVAMEIWGIFLIYKSLRTVTGMTYGLEHTVIVIIVTNATGLFNSSTDNQNSFFYQL